MLRDFFDEGNGESFHPPEDAGLKLTRMGLIWEPDFLAKTLIYLLENNLIPKEGVNG